MTKKSVKLKNLVMFRFKTCRNLVEKWIRPEDPGLNFGDPKSKKIKLFKSSPKATKRIETMSNVLTTCVSAFFRVFGAWQGSHSGTHSAAPQCLEAALSLH